jgi:2-iminobutanoate/2-iminopropanoate deaminase
MKQIIFTENAPFPLGPYSQAVMVNGTLYCSGQIAVDCLESDVQTQTESVCRNIKAVLQAAGLQMQDVVKTTCFLTQMSDFASFNEVYEKHFSVPVAEGAYKPARSCVAARELPKGALVEIEVIAAAK